MTFKSGQGIDHIGFFHTWKMDQGLAKDFKVRPVES